MQADSDNNWLVAEPVHHGIHEYFQNDLPANNHQALIVAAYLRQSPFCLLIQNKSARYDNHKSVIVAFTRRIGPLRVRDRMSTITVVASGESS